MKITNIILSVIAILIGVSLFWSNGIQSPSKLSGFTDGPQFSETNVINGSSSVGTNGVVLITNASNTGMYLHIAALNAVPFSCALAAATSGIKDAGHYFGLFNASAAYVSSSPALSEWTLYGYKGAVACIGSAGSAASFSYTGK